MLTVACGVYASPLLADSDNPGYDRPGYGFTPVVLDSGDVILEQGLPDWSRDREQGITNSLYTVDSLLRVGIGGPVELQVGSSPWNYLRVKGDGTDFSSHGHGDTNVALKLALPSSNKDFTWGLLASVEFTDGAKVLRNDYTQYLLGSALNLQVTERNAVGLYLEDVRSIGQNSTTVALNDNYALTKALTLYAEIAQMHTPDQGSGTVVGGGMAWTMNSHVQIDAGFDRRVAGNTLEWQTNLGVSIYFGH